MKTPNIKSGAGSYRLVRSNIFEHMVSTLELYGEKSEHPLMSMLLEQAHDSEQIELEDNEIG